MNDQKRIETITRYLEGESEPRTAVEIAHAIAADPNRPPTPAVVSCLQEACFDKSGRIVVCRNAKNQIAYSLRDPGDRDVDPEGRRDAVLEYVSSHPGCTIREIAEAVYKVKPSHSDINAARYHVKKLIESGSVRRAPDGREFRHYRVLIRVPKKPESPHTEPRPVGFETVVTALGGRNMTAERIAATIIANPKRPPTRTDVESVETALFRMVDLGLVEYERESDGGKLVKVWSACHPHAYLQDRILAAIRETNGATVSELVGSFYAVGPGESKERFKVERALKQLIVRGLVRRERAPGKSHYVYYAVAQKEPTEPDAPEAEEPTPELGTRPVVRFLIDHHTERTFTTDDPEEAERHRLAVRFLTTLNATE